MIPARPTLTVANGQYAAGDTVLCHPRRHSKWENVFTPFPDKADTEHRNSFEKLRRVLYYPYRELSFIQYVDEKMHLIQ
jgi:hypothetical protein